VTRRTGTPTAILPPTIPVAASERLAEVVQHHRDRDDFPVFFRVFYVLGNSELAPMQSAYDAAVAVLSGIINGASADFREELTEAVGVFNNEGFLSESVRDRLKSLGATEALAHAWAAHYMFSTFGNLERYLETGVPSESRLLVAYPELAKLITPKDCLLPVGNVIRPGHAWVTYRDHDLHPHPGLRRRFGSRIHSEFLALLWSQIDAGNDVAIAVDHYRFCPHGELQPFMELDAWFGAPFTMKDVDDPWKVGATVHGRPRAISPIDRSGLLTEFRWTFADGLKTLEVEELPAPPAVEKFVGPMVCRYVHSIRDTRTKRFIHLDGALTTYGPDEYTRRYAQAVNHHESKVWANRKVKVFRIDAPKSSASAHIEDSWWSELIASFFRGNELVLEYFDGRPYAEIYRSRYGQEPPYWDD